MTTLAAPVEMLDITTHEITDFLFGGVLSAGPESLTAAGRKGVPQMISTGGLDIIAFGQLHTVPKKFEKEIAQRKLP